MVHSYCHDEDELDVGKDGKTKVVHHCSLDKVIDADTNSNTINVVYEHVRLDSGTDSKGH